MHDRTGTDTTVAARSVHTTEPARDHRRLSLLATLLGWCVAAFLSLLGLALVAGIVGGAGAEASQDGLSGFDLRDLGVGAAVGGLIAMFLAYLVGGYTAGRIARWDGPKHGAIVPLWGILFGVFAGLIGTGLGARYAYLNPFGGLDLGELAGATILTALLSLATMFGGAILGGRMGERAEERYLTDTRAPRDTRVRAGRPL